VSLTVLLAYITLVTTETMSYPDSDTSSPKEESIIHPESGGAKYAKFSYGYSSYKGKRFSMEDFHATKIESINGQEIGLFGVFDGHGGSRAAEYLQDHLFENLLKHPKFLSVLRLGRKAEKYGCLITGRTHCRKGRRLRSRHLPFVDFERQRKRSRRRRHVSLEEFSFLFNSGTGPGTGLSRERAVRQAEQSTLRTVSCAHDDQ
jgi:hypothetical protein